MPFTQGSSMYCNILRSYNLPYQMVHRRVQPHGVKTNSRTTDQKERTPETGLKHRILGIIGSAHHQLCYSGYRVSVLSREITF